jgi:putative DNA methylase
LKGQPKRLIEVDLPIKRISEHARREKYLSTITSLHLWWARRPLAACRAVVCAALWPDPADPDCPEHFRQTARSLMKSWACNQLQLLSSESLENFVGFQKNPDKLDDNAVLRHALLDFIADFSNWDNSVIEEYLETARNLTEAAHRALGGAGTRPLVVDSFAGGGSIPLEALRVGADAFASDLNPVPVILNKVVLEYLPQYGDRLIEEVRTWGIWLKEEIEKEMSDMHPKDPDGATPIAYLWARTIICEGPACGAVVPLIRSMWLAKRANNAFALQLVPNGKTKQVELQIITKKQGEWVHPFGANAPARNPCFDGTLKRSSATCPCCGYTTPGDRVRGQFKGRSGGAADARLLAVVLTRADQKGRDYRLPTKEDFNALSRTQKRLSEFQARQDWVDRFPKEPLPYLRSIFNIHLLDVTKWGELFSPRQLLSIVALNEHLARVREKLLQKYDRGFSDAVITCLALAVSREADHLNSGCSWNPTGEKLQHLYGRQALGIIWDFCEANPLADSVGSWSSTMDCCIQGLNAGRLNVQPGASNQGAAQKQSLPDNCAQVFFTDPPYYDAVPYADLSDFFYVWLKRSLKLVHPTLFEKELTPKEEEIVQLAERNPKYAYKTKANFERLMVDALREGRRITSANGIAVIVFAHKTTSAWETMLRAVVEAGWVIVASWPIDTELGTRLRAMNSATLSSSIHLVCRPREYGTRSRTNEVGDWRDILVELPRRIHEWMPRLAEEGVVGADAIFACLGPALEVFSRYSRVEKASGDAVNLNEYLVQVWAAVAKEALNVIFTGADATGFEEDARLTAMWLWTLSSNDADKGESGDSKEDDSEESESKSSTKGYVLEYDAARKIAQGLGAHLESLTSLVEAKGESARLLPVAERTRGLFGAGESDSPTKARKSKKAQLQLGFVADLEQAEEAGSWGSKGAPTLGKTVLDRVHQSMILFAAGRGEALRRFLVDEGVGRDERFWRLAQVLSFLYPKTSDEKRWIDGVLARKKGLGF